jgi:cellulose synthase/poly-beta-1,6-N-acetylglucosamine synthase-like glycosyltransferase
LGAGTLMNNPPVTVIMPVRNEAAMIARSLGAVLAQDYPADRLEILVIDGRSDDQTRSIVQSIAAENPRVRLLDNPGQIQACALNIGIAAAQGEIIVRVDGHTIIAPDYVRQCAAHLYTSQAEAVGGPIRFMGITPAGRAIAVAYRSTFGVPSRYRVSRTAGYVDTVYLGAWRRSIFARVGGFDEHLNVNEDYELNYRIRRAGGRVYLTPDICSDYYGRQTIPKLAGQFYRYGRDKFRMLVKYPLSAKLRHLVAPGFVFALAAGAALTPFNRWISGGWLLLILTYILANLMASVRTAARFDWRVLPRLPLVFVTMHLCWGSGFWVEALRHMTHPSLFRRS